MAATSQASIWEATDQDSHKFSDDLRVFCYIYWKYGRVLHSNDKMSVVGATVSLLIPNPMILDVKSWNKYVFDKKLA